MLPLLLVDCSGRAEALVVEARVAPVVQVVQVVQARQVVRRNLHATPRRPG